MDSIEKRVALVTGGGSGIGYASAERMLRAGWRVVISGRSMRRLEHAALNLRAEVGGESGADGVVPVVADMGDAPSVKRLIDEVVGRLGRLDALVNNAGVGRVLPIERTDLDAIREAYGVNAIGAAYAIHLVWPVFVKLGAGCVVNVSSYAALDPFPGFLAYAATKGALNVMATSCAKEGAAHGIRAFSVAPGAVETELLRSAFDETVVPAATCLKPHHVGRVIADCVLGRRDGDNGKTIYIRRDGERIDEMVR